VPDQLRYSFESRNSFAVWKSSITLPSGERDTFITMKITKYAHACLLIEKDEVRVLIDPGSWNATPDATGLSAILITHEHMDHYDPVQVKALRAANPDATVITHPDLIAKLEADGIDEIVAIEPGAPLEVNGLAIESFGTAHAPIYKVSPCRNTGFLIGGELFVPGDALHDVPTKPVRILALPTGGPWMKLSEAIDYAKAVRPDIVFPIHDAMLIESYQRGLIPRIVGGALEGIEFVDMPAGASREF
jgi:L-ascorbate metabolism protein UlaG (beta-lactamase superfamily)